MQNEHRCAGNETFPEKAMLFCYSNTKKIQQTFMHDLMPDGEQ